MRKLVVSVKEQCSPRQQSASLPAADAAAQVCRFIARWHVPACVAKLKQVLSCLENSSASLKRLAAGVYLSFSLLRSC